MHVAVLGLGEAGRVFADAYLEAGWTVSGFDPQDIETSPSIARAGSVATAVRGADLVLSLTTARHAERAAHDAATSIRADAIYVDLNAGSPDLKRRVVELMPDAVGVDGAVLGSVLRFGAGVEVLVSGARAEQAAMHLAAAGARAEAIGPDAGDASRRKLLRSVFMKGLGALVSESIAAGEAAGQDAWMREQLAAALVDGHSAVDRLANGTRLHAARRSDELGESLALLADLDGAWPVTRGAHAHHLELARANAATANTTSLSDALAAVPTSALGDGGDRLGFVDARVGPVWASPAIAGPARTVLTHAGDNRAVHEAIRRAAPGDVLVIATGGHVDRALLGDLIAERALRAGIRGIVTDGAVRDVAGIAELGLPVWAAGVSPAGPFKHGPGRLDETVAIGGAVCAPGDQVVADGDGVLIVPALHAERTLAAGLAVLADEDGRRAAMRATD